MCLKGGAGGNEMGSLKQFHPLESRIFHGLLDCYISGFEVGIVSKRSGQSAKSSSGVH